MFNVIIKTVLIYLFAMLVMRLMGKRQAGELQPFELIIAVMIAEVAVTPMSSPGVPITYGIVPVVMLLFMHNVIAFISLKSEKMRGFISGCPSIVIEKGVVLHKELKNLNYSLSDLFVQLRVKNVSNINDVHYAVLETNGELSILLKPELRPVNPKDLNISPQNPGFSYDVVVDGKFKPTNFKKIGYTQQDLMRLFKQHKIKQVRDVFFAISDETGKVIFQDYHGKQVTGNMTNG